MAVKVVMKIIPHQPCFLLLLLIGVVLMVCMQARIHIIAGKNNGVGAKERESFSTEFFETAPAVVQKAAKPTVSNKLNKLEWGENSNIPLWMENYLDWHVKTRRNLNADNWNQTKYAIVSCLKTDLRCGGASDRLQSLPWDIFMAARTNRLLLYKWERPCALEEFFQPNMIDWTTPDWLWQKLLDKSPDSLILAGSKDRSIAYALRYKGPLIRFKLQTSDHGARYYNSNATGALTKSTNTSEPSFYTIFGPVWNAFFQPAPPVQEQIDSSMASLGLTPRRYIGAHMRLKYHNDRSTDLSAVQNFIRCTYRQRPDIPIYFASDAQSAAVHAVAYGKKQSENPQHAKRKISVVARTNSSEPLHLDRGADFLTNNDSWKDARPSQFYDVFVDLYLLANAKCVVYGAGGYGQWASLFTTEPCSYRQKKAMCRWDDGPREPLQ